MDWAQGGGGTGYDGMSCGVTVLPGGKSYVAGVYENTAQFGSYIHTTDQFGGLFLNEYSPDGDLVWSKRIARAGSVQGRQMIVADGLDLFLIGGSFAIRYDDDTVPEWTAFLIKVDTAGNVLWHRNYGGGTSHLGFESAVPDGHGGLFVTGKSIGPYLFGTVPISSIDDQVVIAHLDAQGNVLWAKQSTEFASNNGCEPKSITRGTGGNLLVTGNYRDSIGFGNLVIGEPRNAAVPKVQIWAASFDTAGSVIWLKVQAVASDTSLSYADYAYDIVADSDGDFYLCGNLSDSCNLFGTPVAATDGQPFLAKCDPNGDLIWIHLMQGVVDTRPNYPLGYFTSIHLNSANEPIVSGVVHDSLRFGTQHLPWLQGYELCMAHCDTAGNLLNVRVFTGGEDEVSNASFLDADDNLVITGYYGATSLTLVPGSTLVSNGNFDVMVLKLCNASAVSAEPRASSSVDCTIFPNPSNGEFHLAMKALPCRSVFEISDVMGRIVFHENLAPGMTSADIHASNLGSGVYVWKLLSENGRQAQGKISVTNR